jgi:hypothetical protein
MFVYNFVNVIDPFLKKSIIVGNLRCQNIVQLAMFCKRFEDFWFLFWDFFDYFTVCFRNLKDTLLSTAIYAKERPKI